MNTEFTSPSASNVKASPSEGRSGAKTDRLSRSVRSFAALRSCVFALSVIGFLAGWLLPQMHAQSNIYSLGIRGLGTPTQFDAANRLYEEKKFAEAAVVYEGILATGQASPAVYFNLGNAHFKANQLGLAIAAYRKAERVTPRDPDVRANLQFARNQVQGPTLKPNRWQNFFGRLSLDEWTGLSVAGVWLTFGLLALAQVRPALRPILRTPTWFSGGATLALAACLALAFAVDDPREVVVIINKEVAVRNGPLQESQPAFTVHDGAELRVTDRKDDWLQVKDGTRRIGWLKRSDVTSW